MHPAAYRFQGRFGSCRGEPQVQTRYPEHPTLLGLMDCREAARDRLPAERDPYCFQTESTRRLLVTEKIPGTRFARMLTQSLSDWVATTPSSVTWPPLTTIWIDGTLPIAYRSSPGSPKIA